MAFSAPEDIVIGAEYDFVIVGSGGGSMCAAIYAKEAGLNPVILEKLDLVGGSTGYSGGVWWVPNNHVMRAAGVADSAEMAHRYFAETVDFKGKGTSPARRSAFIDEAPRMIEFLEKMGMVFQYADGWSDYYDDLPGGQSRGRSLIAKSFDLNALGPWSEKVSVYPPTSFLPLASYEVIQGMQFKRTWKSRRVMLKLALTIAKNKLLGRNVTASGGAIQARMLEMTLKRGIPVITGFATDRLVEENARVVAVEGMYKGRRTTVRARHGILVNSGGFSRSEEMRRKYQRAPFSSRWTNANPGDTGEMLEEMIRLGADTENLDAAVWVPTSLNPDRSMPIGAVAPDGTEYPFMHVIDVAEPHIIWVDKSGNRFINEANSYMELGETLYAKGAIPAFAIFDKRHLQRYAYGSMLPGMKPVKAWLETGFLTEASTIEDLAAKVGIDPAGLSAQVARFNHYAVMGRDEEFGKGARAYDRFRGDSSHKPNPCVGAISEPPFYAIHIYPADVGTFGGVVSDERGRVERSDGSVIHGLYATGNCTSSVMGRSYPGAGASISPSFTFGYLAAKDVVDRARLARG